MARIVRYMPEQLQKLTEEAEMADSVEVVVAQALQQVLTAGKTGPVSLTPTLVYSLISPAMVPFLLTVLQNLLPAYDLTDWRTEAEEGTLRGVTRVLTVLLPELEREGASVTAAGGADNMSWAERVARSMTTSIWQQIKAEAAMRLGYTHKIWVTRLDERVRTSHAMLEGQTQEGAQPFVTINGDEIKYPGDRDAPLSEWINCRCSLLWLSVT